MNDKASQVARLNNEISRALATGHQPNDLLDARDQVIREINQYVQTTRWRPTTAASACLSGAARRWCWASTAGQLSVAETKEYPGSQQHGAVL